MSQIRDMQPSSKARVIDLVRESGIDVSTWGSSSNPKYCYEWAFIQPNDVVVLNLWYELLREESGTVFQQLNLRETARDISVAGGSSVQIRRAMSADQAIRTAFEEAVPVRVIINDGIRRKERMQGASRVKARKLDSSVWHVGAYDFVTGNAVVVRGERGDHYVDQFSAVPFPLEVSSRQRSARVFNRDAKVRAAVLARARGRCEHCGEPGFSMPSGAVYLETHHVVALADGGPDLVSNVIALCPNHHRRAHHGLDWSELRLAFLRYLETARTSA